MKCVICSNIIDDDSCFCKWCGNPVEEIPWIEEDGLGFPERIPFLTFWREHGKMSVYKRIDEFGRLYSCILFEGKDGKYTIVNFNAWVGAATYLEVQACKRHMLVFHLDNGIYVAFGYQTDEERQCMPVTEETLIFPKEEEEDLPF